MCLICKKKIFLNTNPKNQIIFFLFCRPPTLFFIAVLPVDQKMNLVLPFENAGNDLNNEANADTSKTESCLQSASEKNKTKRDRRSHS